MLETHQGSCHCGRVRFEVDLDLDHVRSCDCSICHKRGAPIHRVEADRLRLLTPLEGLGLYQWHTRVRCLQGVDLNAIPVKRVYGSRLE